MSTFPFGGNTTYQVGDLKVTSPTPGIFPTDFAAVPGNSTDLNYPLQKRPVVTHYFTGVDVPILDTGSIRARLGADYPDPQNFLTQQLHTGVGNNNGHYSNAQFDQLTDQAFSVAFNASLAESYRLKYPLRTAHFTRMFFRAMNKQIDLRIRGSGVRS